MHSDDILLVLSGLAGLYIQLQSLLQHIEVLLVILSGLEFLNIAQLHIGLGLVDALQQGLELLCCLP